MMQDRRKSSLKFKSVMFAALAVCTFIIFQSTPVLAESEAMAKFFEKQKIKDVISQYAFMFDGKNAEGYAALFTEDAVWEMWALNDKKAQTVLNGREQILKNTVERFKGKLATHETRYFATNTLFVELTDKIARTKTMFIGTHYIHGDKSPTLIVTGFYETEFHKTDEGWKIHHRKVNLDIPL